MHAGFEHLQGGPCTETCGLGLSALKPLEQTPQESGGFTAMAVPCFRIVMMRLEKNRQGFDMRALTRRMRRKASLRDHGTFLHGNWQDVHGPFWVLSDLTARGNASPDRLPQGQHQTLSISTESTQSYINRERQGGLIYRLRRRDRSISRAEKSGLIHILGGVGTCLTGNDHHAVQNFERNGLKTASEALSMHTLTRISTELSPVDRAKQPRPVGG